MVANTSWWPSIHAQLALSLSHTHTHTHKRADPSALSLSQSLQSSVYGVQPSSSHPWYIIRRALISLSLSLSLTLNACSTPCLCWIPSRSTICRVIYSYITSLCLHPASLSFSLPTFAFVQRKSQRCTCEKLCRHRPRKYPSLPLMPIG